jgi:hypothetical protein
MQNSIVCPKCGEKIEITEAFRSQIENEVNQSLSKKHEEELTEVKRQAEVQARKQIEEKYTLEQKDLQEQLKEARDKNEQFREQELQLRKEKRAMEEREKEFALEVEKKLATERKAIEEKVLKHAVDEHRLKDLEKEKVISDLKKALEDAQRKAQQGSQQLQGEILELNLEEVLRDNFRDDSIEEIEKGVSGADLRHIVKSGKGNTCGTILWESKQTKAWTDKWVSKLKADLRSEKANVPVIVTTALPEEAKSGLGLKDGVWVCSFDFVLPLATLIRQRLYEVAYQKAVQLHQGDKADLLYEFVTGHEFRQQVEALVEVYNEMQEQVVKERIVFEKQWRAREGQIKRLVFSTASIYGSMQGVVGSSMPQVKGLEMEELGSGTSSQ